jgi:hypothetical protein
VRKTIGTRTTLSLVLLSCGWAATANAANAQTVSACDRECLRVTEDAVEKQLKDVGLTRTVTALRGFRQDFIDERMGVAGAHVMVEESGAPIMLVVRVKVVGDKLTEIELVPTRGTA